MKTSNLYRIQRVSRRFRQLFSLLIPLVAILTIAFWLSFNHLPQGFKGELPVSVDGNLPVLSIALALLVSFIPTSVVIYAFSTLRQLFSLYSSKVIFASENVRCYQQLGYALIYWAMAKIAFYPLISVVLTYHHPPGAKQLVIVVSSSDLATLLTGAIVLIISWVMQEACELENEQALTV